MDPLYFVVAATIVSAIAVCWLKNKIVKALLSLIVLMGFFLIAVLLAVFILPAYVSPRGVYLPFILGGAVFIVCMLLAWKPFNVKIRRAAVLAALGATVLLTAVLAGPDIYKNSIPQADEEIDLFQYMPFGAELQGGYHDTLVKTLNEESALKLGGDLPRLDGATALYPLYSAFVRAAYPEGEYSPYYDLRGDGRDFETIVVCSRTEGAFENLIDGYADVVFLMGVSDEQRAAAEAKGLELSLTPLGREAFVFFVNSRNSVSDLSTADIRRIYSGEAENWREVGGKNDAIIAYQRPDGSGSQTMLKQIMGGASIIPARQEEIFSTMMGMYRRVANYRNYKNSLGYSFLYYISDMIGENKVKCLSVDGIAPTPENIASGAYPFALDFYAVTARRGGEYLNAERTENIDDLIEWTLSPQGQYLVGATGYVPLP
ncbi:MAG: substrate-binding domain-containing protein [Gracilibacteraceae bacterium]|jgi:phosphate transport system substrate-binding protein|nr:substrate-binding domain-containing protein [Gracilibacteraceae bacterium]